jgi:tetratricopeptide (TPR) repeat protein
MCLVSGESSAIASNQADLEKARLTTKKLLEDRKFSEALSNAQELLKNAPSYGRAHRDVAYVLFALGEYNRAEAEVAVAIKLDANDFEAHRLLSSLLMRRGLLEDAIRESAQAVKLKPDSVTNHFMMAILLIQLGDMEHAQKEFDRVIACKSIDYSDDLVKAQAYMALGRIQEAVVALEKIAQANPKHPEIWLTLAQAYEGYGDFQGANQAIENALRIDPKFYPALQFRAAWYLQAMHVEEARKLLNEMIAIDPKMPDAYLMLLQLDVIANDYKGAEKIMMLSTNNLSGRFEYFMKAGQLLAQKTAVKSKLRSSTSKDRSKWAKLSVLALESAAKCHPDDLGVQVKIGELFLLLNQPQEALKVARVAQKLSPDNPQVLQLCHQVSNSLNDIAGSFKRGLQSGSIKL